jgi:mono/diheme cytochrome c family protein
MNTWKKGKFVIAAAVLATSPAFADQAGEREFMVACAVCHGESAMGDGPLASLLNIHTPSLVQLAQQNDGVFPLEAVLATIDGRDGVRAHGSSMPIWGDRYQSSATSERGETSEMVARGRMLSLVYYLQSVQQ